MAGWNGSGTFTGETYTWVNDLNAGVPITASRMDTQFSDITAGINACLAKNGENAATGNLNIGGFRLTSIGNATARTDAITAGQIQDGGVDYIALAGTNTITGTLAPAITAYANGQFFMGKAANTTTAAATLNYNGVGALNMYYSDGTTQLAAGSLIQNNIYAFIHDSSLNASAGGFICLNPSRVASSATVTQTGYASPPTGTLFYFIGTDGKTIYWYLQSSISGTSNATTMTWTGIPAAIQPTNTKRLLPPMQDNGGAATIGNLAITAASGTWTFGIAPGSTAGGFTASGAKGVFGVGNQYTYTLD